MLNVPRSHPFFSAETLPQLPQHEVDGRGAVLFKWELTEVMRFGTLSLAREVIELHVENRNISALFYQGNRCMSTGGDIERS